MSPILLAETSYSRKAGWPIARLRQVRSRGNSLSSHPRTAAGLPI